MTDDSDHQQASGQATESPIVQMATPVSNEQQLAQSSAQQSSPQVTSEQQQEKKHTRKGATNVSKKRVSNRVIIVGGIVCWLLIMLSVFAWMLGEPWYIIIAPTLTILVVGFVVAGYTRTWSQWTGFGNYISPHGEHTEFQHSKTVWDWMQLLLIPLLLAIGGYWFTAQQNSTSLQVAEDQQQETVLETYINHLSGLMLNNNLSKSKSGDVVRAVAQAETLAALRRLDPARKGALVQFLYASGLINKNNVIISLQGADLTNARITNVITTSIGIAPAISTYVVNLFNADLSGADLAGADLSDSELVGINLSAASLDGANLSGDDLSQADLTEAGLYKANLNSSVLNGADLTNADLEGASVTQNQLNKARSLQGATMPDGSKHP
jgi:uncharacterized protein YjbI with pentapeptide repeats